ncbi:ATP-binding protein [Clostridioides difficile]|uniref:ATP-binding protein n=1 Tax=Clostridioides difficile TaxID=1496 RepID=UPI00374E900F
MQVKEIKVSDESIEKVICKDYKEAIMEYVWNGFDAGASIIHINSNENELGGLNYIEIIDNGEGICYENIDSTFQLFLKSQKSENKETSTIHGKKGVGRFSFLAFSYSAKWETVYNLDGITYKYNIHIDSENKCLFKVGDKECSKNVETGTTVKIEGIKDLTKDDIESETFRKALVNKFSWFLFLNREKGYKIYINSKELDYSDVINKDLSESFKIDIKNNEFDIHFVKWNGKVAEKYYYYYLNLSNEIKCIQKKSYRNEYISFYHSVYVLSKYFDYFEDTSFTVKDTLLDGTIKNKSDQIFKDLNEEINKIVENKRKTYLKDKVPTIIKSFKKEGAFPKFRDTKYEQEREQDLEEVITEIYAIEPGIFNRCNIHQKKTIIGFLNLLLDTDEREGIINIMDEIASLTFEQRRDLINILTKTRLSRIIKTMKLIENRYTVIEILKALVYDINKFTNERNHIQKIVEDSYWLFGEQYNLVSADKNFEKALKSYLSKMDKDRGIDDYNEDDYKIQNIDRLRRPDIFMCRSRSLEMPNSISSEENIIIELKEPNVVLNKDVYRQVEDYMDLIMNEKKFNSGLRRWKFILVSASVDDFIKGLYKTSEDKGRAFLVRWSEKFEIYAMTWDDVFKSFEIRHRYLLDKLNMDKSMIQDELEAKGIDLSRKSADILTNNILNLETT